MPICGKLSYLEGRAKTSDAENISDIFFGLLILPIQWIFCLKLDLKFIEEIGDHDQDFINELIADFKIEIPNYLKNIEASIEEKDLDQVVFFVHKLKSPINLFGIFKLEKEFNFIAENSKKITQENDELKASLNSIISTTKEDLALVNSLN